MEEESSHNDPLQLLSSNSGGSRTLDVFLAAENDSNQGRSVNQTDALALPCILQPSKPAQSCVDFLAGSSICLPKSEDSSESILDGETISRPLMFSKGFGQDYLHQQLSETLPKRSLTTKGTTIVVAHKGDHFLFAVDSRESFEHQTILFLLNEELHKQIWLAGRKVFVIYAGDCSIGKACFDYLQDKDEEEDTLEEVVKTAGRFSYNDPHDIDAKTDVLIGGWLEDGRGEMFKLSVKFSDTKLEYATTLKSLKLAERDANADWYHTAIGSGAKFIRNRLRDDMEPHHSLDERKTIVCHLMTLSATRDPNTGGYVKVGHLQRGIPALDCQQQSTRECLIEHFEIVKGRSLHSIFLVYEKNSFNVSDLDDWLGSIGDLTRVFYQLDSIILKIKDSEYFLRSIEVSVELRNNLQVAGKEIERTSELRTLLRDNDFLEYNHAGKSLYVGNWSRQFLQSVEQESNLDETTLLPEECYGTR